MLEAWRHTSSGEGSTLVLPDGCQDLIGVQNPGGETRWLVAALSDRCYTVASATGQRFVGYRLKPGARLDARRLLPQMAGRDIDDDAVALQALHEATMLEPNVHEALQAIAQAPTLALARSHLGVGERSLQRLLLAHGGRPPVYWRRLARWRQAMRQLSSAQPLAEVAADAGYADQAHMNREFRLWLGQSPQAVRRQPELLRLALASGHGG